MWPRTPANHDVPERCDAELVARNGCTCIRCTSDTLTDSRRVEGLARLVAARLQTEPHAVELDLGDVHRADTKLAASLIFLVRVARRRRVRFTVHASPHVEQVLILCRVRSLVDLV